MVDVRCPGRSEARDERITALPPRSVPMMLFNHPYYVPSIVVLQCTKIIGMWMPSVCIVLRVVALLEPRMSPVECPTTSSV